MSVIELFMKRRSGGVVLFSCDRREWHRLRLETPRRSLSESLRISLSLSESLYLSPNLSISLRISLSLSESLHLNLSL